MTNEVLSFCIPTYNRALYLEQCLEQLLPQVCKYNVAIFISDNASIDNTLQIVDSYKDKYEHIYYIKQNQNIGLDQNMLEVAYMSDTKYCWWLGDDDIVIDGSVEKVLAFLLNNDPDFILLNSLEISEDLSSTSDRALIDIHENKYYTDNLIFFKAHSSQMPFGCLIFHRESLINIDLSRYIGTSHAYSGGIFDYLEYVKCIKHKINICVYAEPLVYLRSCKKSWSDYSFNVYFIHIPSWYKKLLPAYIAESNDSLKQFCDEITSLYSLLRFRFAGILFFNKIHTIDTSFSHLHRYKMMLVSLIPNWSCSIIKAAKMIILKRIHLFRRTR